MVTLIALRRLLLNLTTVLSLLLCVAVCMLWVRSRWIADYVYWQRDAADHGAVTRFLFTQPGVVGYGWSIDDDGGRGAGPALSYHGSAPSWFRYSRLRPESVDWMRLHAPPGARPEGATYTVPSWMLVLALAARPALVARRVVLQNNRHRGLCPACGYDLRATPDRCPECGSSKTKPSQPVYDPTDGFR